MDGPCPVPGTGSGFLAGILANIDCNAQGIGASGYQALAAPGSSVSLALTTLLTIFIALFGIRMLLGTTPGIDTVVGAAIKVGIVLTLASSWAAYRTVAYDVVLKGPAEIAGAIGVGLPGADGGLTVRLQSVDDAVVMLTAAGTGRLEPQPATTPGAPAVRRPPITDDFGFGFARILYLGATIGALGLVRLAAGLLLALAPLFAGLLLFDRTQAFFFGWLRMLVATAIGALGVTIVLAVELAILESWLSNVLALRAARVATPAAPLELLVLTGGFATILFGMIGVGARVALAQVPWGPASRRASRPAEIIARLRTDPTGRLRGDAARQAEASRAFVVAEAVAATQRHEAAVRSGASSYGSRTPTAALSSAPRDAAAPVFVPVGRSYRRTARRVSAAAAQRSAIR